MCHYDGGIGYIVLPIAAHANLHKILLSKHNKQKKRALYSDKRETATKQLFNGVEFQRIDQMFDKIQKWNDVFLQRIPGNCLANKYF